MTNIKKKWVTTVDGRNLSERGMINKILESRGIADAERFLNPTADELLPFSSMKNIDLAFKVIDDTLKQDGSFIVYADSDTDGCTSGAIAYRYLKNYTDKVYTYINNFKEHGIKEPFFTYISGLTIPVTTIVVVDAIENDTTQYDRLIEMGYKITVWDHHMIPSSVKAIQEQIALVSSANSYDNPQLSGSGVTWKVCKYIDEMTGNEYADDLADLAAVGLISDMCSMGPEFMENRYICNKGFGNPYNLAIKKTNGSYEFNSTAVSFGIAPLVNSANRIGANEDALNLFLSDDDSEVATLIKLLKAGKEAQNEEVARMMIDLEEQAETQMDKKCMFFTIKSDIGVTGLVANKLVEKYQRPVIVIKEGDEENKYAQGSMRAIGVKNMTAIINRTGIGRCNGHENAAGFICAKGDLGVLSDAIEKSLAKVTFVQEKKVDIKLREDQINEGLICTFKALNRIFGGDFKPITAMIEGVEDYTIGYMSNGKHLKLATPTMLFIKWNGGDIECPEDKSLTAIGTLDCGMFGRKFYLQLIMEDFDFSDKIDLDFGF